MSDIIKIKDQDDNIEFVMDGDQTITEKEYQDKYTVKDKEVDNESNTDSQS